MKYDPLEKFLRETSRDTQVLSFAEVEAIIGQSLPPSARKHEAWWSNSGVGRIDAKAWLRAGYRAEQIDLQEGQVVFRRCFLTAVRRHPAFGGLAGTVQIMPGVDLTEPADPEWGGLYD
jgi:hypothetical protein